MPDNHAAYMVEKGKPLEVRSAPYTKPDASQIVIRSHALATNPVDFIKIALGNVMFGYMKMPFPLGFDVAGEVVEVGTGITRFSIGDRIVGMSVGMDHLVNRTAEAGFQEFVILRDELCSPIPEDMSYEQAAVIPLGTSTAACALFGKDQMALDFPSAKRKQPNGETVIVWGGSTSVGCCAIQLARDAGYRVIATASPKNHDLMKRLGASLAFDYRSPTVTEDIKSALKDGKCAGAVAIGAGSTDACIDIVGGSTPGKRGKWVAQCSAPFMPTEPPSGLEMFGMMTTFVRAGASSWVKSKVKGVGSKFVQGGDVLKDGLGKSIWVDYLPQAMRDGSFVPHPEPMVVGHGLKEVQAALELHKKGVSARKPIVTL